MAQSYNAMAFYRDTPMHFSFGHLEVSRKNLSIDILSRVRPSARIQHYIDMPMLASERSHHLLLFAGVSASAPMLGRLLAYHLHEAVHA